MEFTKCTPEETAKLRKAIEANVLLNKPIRMDPVDTTFLLDDRQLEEELINAIKSVPTHFAPSVKFFEVRDRGTMIPVMAILLDGKDSRLLHYAGFSHQYILLTVLTDVGRTHYDPYGWPANPRTMRQAHIYIDSADWPSLQDGQVIDVEFLLGETAEPKQSDLDA